VGENVRKKGSTRKQGRNLNVARYQCGERGGKSNDAQPPEPREDKWENSKKRKISKRGFSFYQRGQKKGGGFRSERISPNDNPMSQTGEKNQMFQVRGGKLSLKEKGGASCSKKKKRGKKSPWKGLPTIKGKKEFGSEREKVLLKKTALSYNI